MSNREYDLKRNAVIDLLHAHYAKQVRTRRMVTTAWLAVASALVAAALFSGAL
jgi:hypothetical protein